MGRLSVNIGGGGGVSSDEVTAAAAQVLKGKTYVGSDTNDEAGTGTMPDRGAIEVTLGAGQNYTIPEGYHNGKGKVNMRSLADVTASGTITDAEQILFGYKAYSDGVLYTGTMRNYGAQEKTLDAGESYVIPKGYHNGNGKISAETLAQLTEQGNAEASQILRGSKAYVKGFLVSGSMPNLSLDTEIDYSDDNSTPVIETDHTFLGTNSDGEKRILLRYAGKNGYLRSNTLFGYPASEFGDADAAHILLGKKATSENGIGILGSMLNLGAQNKTFAPGASKQSYVIREGYHNGKGEIVCEAVKNLTAANIKKGIEVGGVLGTWEGYCAQTTYLFSNPTNTDGFTIPANCGISGGSLWWNVDSTKITSENVYDLYKYDRLIIDVGIDPAYSSVKMTYGIMHNLTPFKTGYASSQAWENNRPITENTSIIVYLSQCDFAAKGKLFITGNKGLRVFNWYLVKD